MIRIAFRTLLTSSVLLLLSGCGEPEPPQPEVAAETPATTPRDTLPGSSTSDTSAADTTAPESAVISEVRYQCAEDLQVQASYEQDSVTLHLQGETHLLEVLPRDASLAQTPSASGVRYANEDLTWHSKGSEALLSAGDDTRVCLQLSY